MSQKVRQEKLIKFIKVFELYQVYMHNVLWKMYEYSQIIYCLQEKSRHFGLEVSVGYVVLAHFESKKSNKIHKDFLTLSNLMYNFLSHIVLIFTNRISTFWCAGSKTFCPKNQAETIDKIQKYFWTTSSLYI